MALFVTLAEHSLKILAISSPYCIYIQLQTITDSMKCFPQVVPPQAPEEEGGLFTRLKHNIMLTQVGTQMVESEYALPDPVADLLRRHELQFEVLKLEKANLIAQQHLRTGQPVRVLLRDVLATLEEQIQQIISKGGSGSEMEKGKSLQSTFCNSNGQKKAASHANTPKIVEFTLGGKQNSSSEQQVKGEEVSQFFINSKGMTSRNIKQKLIRQRRCK